MKTVEDLLKDIKPIITEDKEVIWEQKPIVIMNYQCILSKNTWKINPSSNLLSDFWRTAYVGVERGSPFYKMSYRDVQYEIEKQLDGGLCISRELTFSDFFPELFKKDLWFIGFDTAGFSVYQCTETAMYERLFNLVQVVDLYNQNHSTKPVMPPFEAVE